MPYNSRAEVCRLRAERYNTKSNVKLGGFQSQFEASYASSHTDELCYNETMTIYMCACVCACMFYTYLPTPPLGQDMTQGQFF